MYGKIFNTYANVQKSIVCQGWCRNLQVAFVWISEAIIYIQSAMRCWTQIQGKFLQNGIWELVTILIHMFWCEHYKTHINQPRPFLLVDHVARLLVRGSRKLQLKSKSWSCHLPGRNYYIGFAVNQPTCFEAKAEQYMIFFPCSFHALIPSSETNHFQH